MADFPNRKQFEQELLRQSQEVLFAAMEKAPLKDSVKPIPMPPEPEMEAHLLGSGWRKRWSDATNRFIWDDWYWGRGINAQLFSSCSFLGVAYRKQRRREWYRSQKDGAQSLT